MSTLQLTICLALFVSLSAFRARDAQTLQLNQTRGVPQLPQLPFFLKTLANQCHCAYVGECSCAGSVSFMKCISNSCTSGACDCRDNEFLHACGAMSSTCPGVALTCTNTQATCVTSAGNGTAPAQKLPSANTSNAYTEQQKVSEAPEATAVQPNSNDDGPWYVRWGRYLKQNASEIIKVYGVYCLLVLLFAFIYHQCFMGAYAPARCRDKDAHQPMGAEWMACGFTYYVFDCGNLAQDWHICLMALFCPLIRFAETISRSPTPPFGFWPALIGMLILVCLQPMTMGITGIIFLLFWVWWRGHLRSMYNNKKPHKGAEMVADCGMVFCCSWAGCCMLAQEAREVEYRFGKNDSQGKNESSTRS